MQAGRELDALVATRIMGYYDVTKWNHEHGTNLTDTSVYGAYINPSDRVPSWSEMLPHYSTDIAAAWQVVEKIGEWCAERDSSHNDISVSRPDYKYNRATVVQGGLGYYASFLLNVDDTEDWIEFTDVLDATAKGDTAPLAICLAALKAVGVEVE